MKPVQEKHKQLKNINVKGTVVQSKDGTHFRKSYDKQMRVNVDNKNIKHTKKSINDKDIESSKPLDANEGGISNGVQFIKFKDGSTGYFKPVTGEPFVRKISSP